MRQRITILCYHTENEGPFPFACLAQPPSEDLQQPSQIIRIEKIKPSTTYRFTIFAKSRAGTGQQNGPTTFRTLDRQIPDFKIVQTEENKNETCANDRSCLIKWTIESDGGAPIIRAEVLYAKVAIPIDALHH